MSDITVITLPLTGSQILARLEALEQNQIASASVNQPAITAPPGVRMLSASTIGQMGALIPRQRPRSPFDY